MAKKFYEIIMVPSTSAQFIRYRVSYRTLLWTGLGFCVLFLVIGFLFWRYLNIQSQRADIAEAREASYHLHQESGRLRTETTQLEAKLKGFRGTVDEFKKIFGVQSQGSYVGKEAGPGMNMTETRESEQYNAFLYMATLRAEPEKRILVDYRSLDEVKKLGVVSTRIPSIKPVRHGFMTSGFGYRIDPFTGQTVHHKALDITAWYWEEVLAPADGLVVKTGYNAGIGRFIELSHGFGYTTRYAHLQKYTALPGDRVRRYDVIGYVGNTGRSTGPHLHYEIRFAGIPVDPTRFISDSSL